MSDAPVSNLVRLEQLRQALHQLLDLPASLTAAVDIRERTATTFIRNELSRVLNSDLSEIENLQDAIEELSANQIIAVETRCLYYGCDELTRYLAARQLKGSLMQREEAVLYVQERLQRDGFRRIRHFQANREASFKTYIWRVIGNLLIDFVRSFNNKHSRFDHSRTVQMDGTVQFAEENRQDYDNSVSTQNNSLEDCLDQQRLSDLMSGLLRSGGIPNSDTRLHEKLRPCLDLSHQERLFLKAMFIHDLTISEIRRLPGFEMGQNEAYRYYYQLMQKLMEAFKQANVTDELRQLVKEHEYLPVEIDGEATNVTVSQILCLQKQASSLTKCLVLSGKRTLCGWSSQSFTRLKKQFASYFTEIDPSTLIGDSLLREQAVNWDSRNTQTVEIPQAGLIWTVKGRYLKAIRRRFSTKPGVDNRISSQGQRVNGVSYD